VAKEFTQSTWNKRLDEDLRRLLASAIEEDLGEEGDLTSLAVVPEYATARAVVVARQSGVVAGLPAVEPALHAVEPELCWTPEAADGRPVGPGDRLGRIEGSARGMLAAERLVLNLLGRLSGIATLTSQYVRAVSGTKARIYDTRKTTPGWRRLEKYAVRAGGGFNHRAGLFDAVLIKDNHLALGTASSAASSNEAPVRYTPAEAVRRARRFVKTRGTDPALGRVIVEIEVDTLEQFDEVLPERPDIILLDNMAAEELRAAVARRDALVPEVELEASGGIDLETVRGIAESGVDRISVGALTHSAVCLDVALDWLTG
jgi:nicotinate-nucleotide pyrophosphorylase (carboxylating)